jgi:arylsulfatase A-like enzyme
MGYGDLGLYGAPTTSTPHIDRLGAEGTVLTQWYSAHAICTPSRAAMMTGRYAWRTGIGRAVDENTPRLSPEETTVVDVIGIEQSAYIGKWHLTERKDYTHPGLLGWPYFSGTITGTLQDYFAYEKTVNGTPSISEVYATTAVVDDALAWLEGHDEAPWMLWVAFNAAHTPLHAPPADLHGYDLTGLNSDTDPLPFYQAMIQAMDTELGRLLEAVDRDNTVIIYLSDNGSLSSVNQGLYPQGHGKGSLGQGGVHVPLIITGPGVEVGSVDAMVHAVDLYATVLDLLGESSPDDTALDSMSLMPYLDDPYTEPQRERMLTELFGFGVPEGRAGRSARSPDHKLVRLFKGTDQLYDLQSDPYGTVDLLGAGALADGDLEAYQALSDYLDQIAAKAEQ